MNIAEQIRMAVERLQIPNEGNPHGVVTVSIGCSTQVPEVNVEASRLVQAADSALYQAKSLGRNRVEIAQPVLSLQETL
jgi:diguanylate cyclase (GGDEF)-like protein